MKLIATLATLAALIGQTEAATLPANIIATHDQVSMKHCDDKISILAKPASADVLATASAGKKATFKLPDNFKLEGTFALATHVDNIDTGSDLTSAQLDLKSTVTGLAYNATTNEVSFTFAAQPATGATNAGKPANGDQIMLKLKAVCNYMTTVTSSKYTWKSKQSNVKFMLETADPSIVTSSDETVAPVTGKQVAAFTDVKLVEIPTKGATGKIKIEFTADATAATEGAANKFLHLNLPTGYKFKGGAKCKVGPKAAPVEITAAVGSTDTAEHKFTLGTPAGAIITAAALAVECDKVIATATAPTPFDGDVAIKIGTLETQAKYAGYSKSITTSPTKSPTKKPDDSPASVATASGVVVGALGVAALFLA